MDAEKSPFLGGEVEDESEMLDLTESIPPFSRVRHVVGKNRACTSICVALLAVVGLAVVLATGIAVGHFAIPGSVGGGGGGGCGNGSASQEICANPPVLLISLDGFRSSYLTRELTPNIQNLIEDGVRAAYMRSVFPTKTFPNHYSIVTGLYPESHGIVSNSFYDSQLRRYFHLSNPDASDTEWWKGEPVWVTAAKQDLVTGVKFWPGSEAEIKGYRPTYYSHYNKKENFSERVDTVLGWFDLPKTKRPQFFAAYFDQPDEAGHKAGPDSALVNTSLGEVDEAIGRLWEGLQRRNISDCVNIMIVSDHGMSLYNNSTFVNVDDLLPSDLISSGRLMYPSYGTTMNIVVDGGDEVIDEVYESLVTNGTDKDYPFRVFHIHDIPLRMHTGHYSKERYGSLFVIGDDHSYVTNKSRSRPPIGNHGHDNIEKTMQAIFIAHGPAFKRKHVSEPIANIQLYSLMCDLLNITAAPNNGTHGSLHRILKPQAVKKLPPAKSPGGSPGVTNSCPYPHDDSWTVCDDCLCNTNCTLDKDDVLANNRKIFNHTHTQEVQYQTQHFPWGVPPGGRGSGACVLTQPSYVTIYSNALRIPLLVGYTQTGRAGNDSGLDACIRRDPRITAADSANCSVYNLNSSAADHSGSGADMGGFPFGEGDSSRGEGLEGLGEEEDWLFPVALPISLHLQLKFSTHVLTALVPQQITMRTAVWVPVLSAINDWLDAYPTLNIMIGSVLDANRDGLRDSDSTYPNRKEGVAIPSHMFVVVTRCGRHEVEMGACPVEDLEVLGMLFQHPLETGDYLDPQRVLRYSLTPLRDIEAVTGLNFFPKLSAEDQNLLELRLLDELWPAKSLEK